MKRFFQNRTAVFHKWAVLAIFLLGTLYMGMAAASAQTVPVTRFAPNDLPWKNAPLQPPAGYSGAPNGYAPYRALPQFQEQQPQYQYQQYQPAPQIQVGLTKAALLLPLSGPEGPLGQALMQAAQMAVFEVAEKNFALLPYDAGNTMEQAETAARQAINDGARLILGPLFARQAQAVATLAREAQISVVSFSNDWTIAGQNLLVMGFVPQSETRFLLGEAQSQGAKRVYMLLPENSYGQIMARTAQDYAAQNGIEMGGVSYYPDHGTEPLAEAIQKIADARAKQMEAMGDVLIIGEGGTRLLTIAALLPKYNLAPQNILVMGTSLWQDNNWVNLQNMNGAQFAGSDSDKRRDFENKFLKYYARPAPRLASLVYDGTALAAVLAKRGSASAFNFGLLLHPNGFNGVDGIFRFQQSGVAERNLALLTVENGAARILRPAASSFRRNIN